MAEILIYTELSSARLLYTVNEFIEKFTSNKVLFTTDKVAFANDHATTKICYHKEKLIPNCLHVVPHGLLAETGIRQVDIAVEQHAQWEMIFFKQAIGDTPFDVFAAVFFLLSRYEEYGNTKHDEHGRYAHEMSVAYQNGFLEIPLIDKWRMQLFRLLNIALNKQVFTNQITIDIDHAYRYRGLKATRWLLKWMKSLLQFRLVDVKEQLAVAFGNTQDPYDTFAEIKLLCDSHHAQPIFFILMDGKTQFDKQIKIQSVVFEDLVRNISTWGKIGIHPSYETMQDKKAMASEKQELELILSKKVSHSRQHYLRYALPQTMKGLIGCDIVHDYGLGYSKHVGFRASTSFPINWYNLLEEQTTSLILHSTIVMDTTLRYAMKLTPKEAKQKISYLFQQVKQTNGTFISIWHNSNLSHAEGWQEWKSVFEHLFIAASK